MLICIPDVLSKADVAEFRAVMDAVDWEDGRSTAGAQSAEVKKNEQLPPNGEVSRKLGERVIKALAANPLFVSAAIPRHIFPPLFNRYGIGQHFGVHVDNAVRGDHLTGMRIRTDLSVTLFLSEPDEYDGGELIVEDYYGSHEVSNTVLVPARAGTVRVSPRHTHQQKIFPREKRILGSVCDLNSSGGERVADSPKSSPNGAVADEIRG